MNIYVNPDRREWNALMRRAGGGNASVKERVADVLKAVKEEGDAALERFALQFDGVKDIALVVSRDEMAEACSRVPQELKDAIDAAAQNIEKFHAAQYPLPVEVETMPGVWCVQKALPIQRVGLYIPGGSAPLFSTVLMLAIPAKIAGCKEIVMCSPASSKGDIADAVLYAAAVCGVTKVYRVGGAQAIGAMAYGTQTIEKVDKIFGPGNQYVTEAKQQVSVSDVAIDMPAGPSEVLVMADYTANVGFVAADLLSQAEHGPDSQAMLLTNSRAMADRVMEEIKKQLSALPRKEIAARALDNSRIVVMDDRDDMIDFANGYAAEHLIISMDDPWGVAERITAAGSVFIGNYSPESAGDYASGTNHTLPTYGWAKSFSGVNVESYMRRVTFQEITPDGLHNIGGIIEKMASAEGLDAHRNAVRIRLDELDGR